MEKFFVQRRNDDLEVFGKVMSANELIDYINMDDCHNEDYHIFDFTSEFGKMKELFYKGWQPNCLIEVVDEQGNVVLRGYGEDH